MNDPLAVLQRIRGAPSDPRGQDVERCELCAEPIAGAHGHLVDLQARALLCACRPCYLLFTPGGAGGGHYRSVPDRYLDFPDFELSPAQWESLQIPVGIAFFFVNSVLGRVAAFYPGPAGATESELSLDTWDEVVRANPALVTLAPDVEAFLVRADRGRSRVDCFLVPIDACYELVGRLRRSWRGFDGGREAREELNDFFAKVQGRLR